MSTENGFILEFDVAVVSKKEIPEDDVVSKLFSAFADQDDIQMVICPLFQTVQRAKNESYNKAISDAIEVVKNMATASPDNNSFFKKFGTYHYPYSLLISELEQLIKPSQSPNQ